jgi:curli biogenesis system outer membrane secretion channel CsgG
MKFGMLKWSLLFAMLPMMALAQQKTLYVARVTANEALKAEVAHDERAQFLGRVIESLDEHLITEIVSSRKYRVLERSDAMEELLREQALNEAGLVAKKGAQANEMIGGDYALIVSIDAFQQVTDTAVFNGVHRAKVRYQLSAQMRVIDTSTAEIIDASNHQLETVEIADVANTSNRRYGRFDAMLPKLTREMAKTSAKFLLAATFPPKIIDVDENYVTINAGEGIFKVGDVCKVYGKTRTVTDPDTGVTRKIKGRPTGTVKITEVEADYAQGELMGDARASVGSQVKPLSEK